MMRDKTQERDKRDEDQGGPRQTKTGRAARGFATMDEKRQREIASEGGRAAHQQGKAHEFTPEEAREAGRKGGQASGSARSRARQQQQQQPAGQPGQGQEPPLPGATPTGEDVQSQHLIAGEQGRWGDEATEQELSI